jgi:hypothetical protein
VKKKLNFVFKYLKKMMKVEVVVGGMVWVGKDMGGDM